MIDKKLVKTRFTKNLKTYSENSIVQKTMADRLIELIPDINFQSVLELGCGCGTLTEKLIKNFSFKNYTAVDIVEKCREYILNINPDINFMQSDIENLNLQKKYDLIISNATFQWIENLDTLINKLKNLLTPNGILIFSTFGPNNFKEITKITNVGLKYYSIGELMDNLSPIYIEESKMELEFNSPIEVLKYLKCTGVNSVKPQHWTKSDLQNFNNKYTNICPDKIKLTYNPIYIVINKTATDGEKPKL